MSYQCCRSQKEYSLICPHSSSKHHGGGFQPTQLSEQETETQKLVEQARVEREGTDFRRAIYIESKYITEKLSDEEIVQIIASIIKKSNKLKTDQIEPYLLGYIDLLKSPKYRNALHFYSNIGDGVVNAYLKNDVAKLDMISYKYNVPIDEIISDGIKLGTTLMQMISRLPVFGQPLTVYRGVKRSNVKILNVGDLVELNAFTSTSTDSAVSIDFTDKWDGCCLYQINLPTNIKGLFIQPYSQHGPEREFLLPPGYLLKYLGTAKHSVKYRRTYIDKIVYKFDCINADEMEKYYSPSTAIQISPNMFNRTLELRKRGFNI